MGFGIINHISNEPQIFLYSKGIKTGSMSIDINSFNESTVSSCHYTVGNEPIGLESGEEVVLAVYRQGEGPFRSGYEYHDLDAINELINKDTIVLLLKIKVEERDSK